MFGQASTGQSSPMFGQASSGQPAPLFGQASSGQSAPMFGQSSSGQSAPMFGQASSGQSMFGQAASGQSAPLFGQASSVQSAPLFGQASSGQSAPLFGQAATGQSAPLFGQAATGQSAPLFGQGTSVQSAPVFGQASAGQSASTFGQPNSGQSPSTFGQTNTGQSVPAFGLSTITKSAFVQATVAQSTASFGQVTTSLSAPTFGQAPTSQSAPAFGKAPASQPSAFGQASTSQPVSTFGQTTASQSATPFGQVATNQSTSHFAQPSSFGQASSAHGAPAFGKNTSIFGQAIGGTPSLADQSPPRQSSLLSHGVPGQSSLFGQGTSGQSFGMKASAQTSLFGESTTGQSFGIGQVNSAISGQESQICPSGQNTSFSSYSKTAASQDTGSVSTFGIVHSGQPPSYSQATSGQTSLFGNSVALPSFSPGTSGSEQRSVFGQKSGISEKVNVFEETSVKTPVFGQTLTQTATSSGKPSGLVKSFVAPTQMNTGSDSVDNNLPTSSEASSFRQITSESLTNVEQSFRPPANSTFKPIFGNPSVTDKPTSSSFPLLQSGKINLGDQASYTSHAISGLSGETQSAGTFSFTSVEKKSKDETVSSRPAFAGVSSTFPSLTSNSGPPNLDEKLRREEPVKGMKRKEDQSRSPLRHEQLNFEAPSASHSSHPPEKRSSRLGRQLSGGANLLVRSLYDVVKSHMKPTQKKDPSREEELISEHEEAEHEMPPPSHSSFSRSHPASIASQAESLKTFPASGLGQQEFGKGQPAAAPSQTASGRTHNAPGPFQTTSTKYSTTVGANQQASSRKYPATGPIHPTSSRAHPLAGSSHQSQDRKHSVAGPSHLSPSRPRPLLQEVSPDFSAVSKKTPLRRARRADSSTGPLSPNECTAIQVINLPIRLNQKQFLEKHFSKFGKVQRLYCKPARKLAIIHFSNHAAAAAAKTMGKKLHKDISIFWQRKKASPNKKETLSVKREQQSEEMEERLSDEETSPMPSPVRKPLLRETSAARAPKGSPPKKPLSAKTVQFEMESSDSQGPSSESAGISLPPSLAHLLGSVAESSEEKYRLLDQRDKIMRQARVKRTELDQAKVFIGTCPDMCPEKERYMRDTRNQLSLYEFFPGTDKIDHAATIKEYSRSSADQEEPLPHELRPTPILNMTMDYLVTQIMDQGEENYRDWYDFVWNRTRGIRKDITQQHLCDPVTVSLMEKCMRFHIHCAHQLCEEPMSSFDAKINNENLTKCLQSLKEMYQDLQNRGVFCSSEPEFRGYSVLLNLNKGDILREVQQFHPSVRNSAEVKFAVQVFAALNSTNFVRFFKLVQSASYLNGCILHCYFNQIRRDALRVLNVAYTASTLRSTSFPLENMVRLLFFHDSDEATEFLMSYGLSVTDGNVELNRAAFVEPEVPSHPKKCLFISQKRHVSVGEVVNGAPLPPFTLHIPVCSFDAQNKFVGWSSTAEPSTRSIQEPVDEPVARDFEPEEFTVKRKAMFQPVAPEPTLFPEQSVFQPIVQPEQPPSPPKPPPSPPKPLYSDEDVVAVLENLIEDIVKEYSCELGQTGAAYISTAQEQSSAIADLLFTDVISEFSHKVVVEEVRAETDRVKEEKRRKEEAARLKLEREKLLAGISLAHCKDLLKEVLTESIYSVSSEELQQAVQKDYDARLARCSEDVCEKCMSEFLDEEILHAARESQCEMQYYSKYMQRWKDVLATRKKLRRQMRGFPAAPGSVGHEDKLKALIPSATLIADSHSLAKGFLNLGNAGKLCIPFIRLHHLRKHNFHQMKVQHFFQKLLCDAAWTPLELTSLIAENLSSWKKCIFWKVVLILPESSEPDDPSSVLSEWLMAKFSGMHSQDSSAEEQRVKTLSLYSSLESPGDHPVWVNVCVKVAQGLLTSSELEDAETQKDLLGTSGLVLLLPPRIDVPEEDVYWLTALLQLKQLLQAKPFQPPLPLAVLVPGICQDSVEEVEDGLSLADLISCGLISEYIVVPIPDSVNDMQGTDKVTYAVEFLLSHCPRSLELCSFPLRQYIEDGVCRGFSDPFHHDVCERRKAGLPPQDPAAIIDLYNDVLAFLADAASSEQLCDISWPVTEFTCPTGSALLPQIGWNSPSYLAWLKKVVLSFQIPQMDKPPQGAPWTPVCTMIHEYVSQICRCPRALPVLLSELQILLGRAYERWYEREGDEKEEFPVHEIPWDDLLTLCINHRLRDWESPVRPENLGSQEGELCVHFLQDDVSNFIPPETWCQAQLNTLRDVQEAYDRPKRRHQVSLRTTSFQKNLNVTPQENTEGERLNTKLSRVECLDLQLTHSLQAEAVESKRFEEELKQLLQEEIVEPSASLSLPLYLPEATQMHQRNRLNLTNGAMYSSVLQMPLETDGFTLSPLKSLESALTSPRLQRAQTDSVCTESVRRSLAERIQELDNLLTETQQKDRMFEMYMETQQGLGDHYDLCGDHHNTLMNMESP
ncbi:germinal-center associated nuclear protein [Rhinophrynus dorsalis]